MPIILLTKVFLKWNKYLLLSLIILSLQSCSYDKKEVDLTPCSSFVSFRFHIRPIVDLHCAKSGCHVAGFLPGDYSVDSVFIQKARAGKVYLFVFELKNMPPARDLTDNEKEKLKCWLDAGAPDN